MDDSYEAWQIEKRQKSKLLEKDRVREMPPTATPSAEEALKDWFGDCEPCWISAWEVERWWRRKGAVGQGRYPHAAIMRKLGFKSKVRWMGSGRVLRVWEREALPVPPLPY